MVEVKLNSDEIFVISKLIEIEVGATSAELRNKPKNGLEEKQYQEFQKYYDVLISIQDKLKK